MGHITLQVESDAPSAGLRNPVRPILEKLAQALEAMPALQAYADDIDQDLTIHIRFTDQEGLSHYDVDSEHCMGCFCTTKGADFDPDEDEIDFNDRFLVAINTDMACLERMLNFYPDDHPFFEDDLDIIEGWLATLPHELVHCLEFICNSGGRTPGEVFIDEEEGGVYQCTTGEGSDHYGHDFPEDAFPEEIHDIMEARVESVARDWMGELLRRQVIDQHDLSAIHAYLGEAQKPAMPKKSRESSGLPSFQP